MSLPKNGPKGLEWTQSNAVHPFWFIQRADKDDIVANAQIVQQEWTHVTACAFKAVISGAATIPPITNTFSVSMPFIVNTHAIEAGQEVILQWRRPPSIKRKKGDAASTCALDQILQQDLKRRKAKAAIKGAGA